jgi:hypothetical protein
LCPVLADPNLRFYRPLASRSTPANQSACLTTRQTIDLIALNNHMLVRTAKLFDTASRANA